jgi:hypothetical protein
MPDSTIKTSGIFYGHCHVEVAIANYGRCTNLGCAKPLASSIRKNVLVVRVKVGAAAVGGRILRVSEAIGSRRNDLARSAIAR